MKFTHYKLIEAKRAPHGLPAISRYMCDECKSFHTSPDLAELCCDQSCRHCGKPLPPGKINDAVRNIFWACDECLEKERYSLVLSRLRKAEVVQQPSTSWVYSDDLPGGYINLSDYENMGWTLAEIVEDVCRNAVKPVEMPSYVYDCDAESWSGLNLSSILEDAMQEWFDDAQSFIEGGEELEAAIARFNERQTLTQYHASERIIILDPVAFQSLTAEGLCA